MRPAGWKVNPGDGIRVKKTEPVRVQTDWPVT
jgi:hypothetical protein